MKKIAISIALALAALLFAGAVFAHNGLAAITAADLGVSQPSLLPTSPLYFVKEWGRGIRLFFTFNPVSKADLQLRFADEKLIEAKTVTELNPAAANALIEALANYKEATTRLVALLQVVKDTSQNPNVDALLTKLSDRVVKHEKLFDELKENAATSTEKDLNEAEDELGRGVLAAGGRLEDNEKLIARLKKAADEGVSSDLEKIKSVELFDRLEGKAESSDLKELLRKTREDAADDFEKVLGEELKGTSTVEDIVNQLKTLPGDEALRAKLIAEIRLRAKDHQKELKDIEEGLREEEMKAENQTEKAAEQIKEADEKIGELEEKIGEHPDRATPEVKTEVALAKEKLASAQKAFADKNYGEAFGQATSAEALARNALRRIEKSSKNEQLREEKSREKEKSAKECGPMPLFPIPARCSVPVCKDGKWKVVCPEKEEKSSELDKSEKEENSSQTGASAVSPAPTASPTETPAAVAEQAFRVEADDAGFYPSGTIIVAKGVKVSLTFAVRTTNVYFGGLDFRSTKFKTETVKPGASATVEFTTDESFDFTSYWPLTNTSKATGKVVVQ